MSDQRTRSRTALYALAACALLGGGVTAGRCLPAWWHPAERPTHVIVQGQPGSPETDQPELTSALLQDGIAKVSPQEARVVRAEGMGRAGKLLVAAPPPPPTVQESLQKIQKSMERLERMAPTTEETLREYRDLAKSMRETIPDLRETNKELQKLIKNANDMAPMTRKALDEFTIAARNWGMVGERANVLLRTNEDQINSIVKNADKVMAGLAELLKQDNLNDVATILRNFAEGSKRFPAVTRNTEEFFREGRETQSAFRDTLRRTDDVLDQLRGGKSGQQGRGTLKEFEDTAIRINRTMTDLHELLRASAQSDGTLRRFLTDPSLYNHLDDTALMLTRTIPRLDRVLKDLEVFADKLARHPEALGLGGVVRPSAGLKEPPTHPYYPPQRLVP